MSKTTGWFFDLDKNDDLVVVTKRTNTLEAVKKTMNAFKVAFRQHCTHNEIIDDNGIAACKFCGCNFELKSR